MKLHCDNNIIPHFAQIPRGLSQIFKIMPQKSSDATIREIKLSDDIVYRGKYLNGYDLRVFLFLFGQLSVNRKVAKRLNAKHSEVVRLLDADVYSSDRIVAPALADWNDNKEIKKMIDFYKLRQKWDNKAVFEKSLMNLENSYLYSSRLKYNGKLIAVSYTRQMLIFNPIFYALTEKSMALTTIDLNVAKAVAKDINKLIIYYALCDKVDFGESITTHAELLFSLWHSEETKSRQAKNKRVHFIFETLNEITKLSNDFKISFSTNKAITIERTKTLKQKAR